MTTTTSTLRDNATRAPRAAAAPDTSTQLAQLTRSNCEGRFSVLGYGPVKLVAEPGLVIRVHTGCLWVPHHAEHGSVGVGAGERFVVRSACELTTLATDGTQIELDWPARSRAERSLLH